MNAATLVEHARRLAAEADKVGVDDYDHGRQAFVQASEFLRRYAGESSAFYHDVSTMLRMYSHIDAQTVASVLRAYANFAEAGLHAATSPERTAQLDVVADYLEQAASLLQKDDVHPAAPAMLIGATLEEFLRTWLEECKLQLNDRSRGLDTYSAALRTADKITKQDVKDITSWAGLRNSAAHGRWEEVADRSRVQLMLEGVNLFIRKYGEPAA
jgi:hypothetical protein